MFLAHRLIHNFPFYPQYDMMDCGPACLRMIAKHAGKSYTLQTLRNKCYISREGVSLLGISDAAESIGFRTLGVRVTSEELACKAPLPCIVHWHHNHFVVLYRVKKLHNGKYRFYIADPAKKKNSFNQHEFEQYFCGTIDSEGKQQGIALILTPGPDFDREPDESAITTHRDLLFFARYFKPYKSQLIQLVSCMALSCGIQLIFPFLTQAMVDVGIGGRNLSFITLILLAQLAFFAAQIAVGFIRSWITLHINSRIDISLISDFLLKLMKLPLSYFDTKLTGDLMQRIRDHSRVKQFLMGNSVNIVFSVTNFFIFASILGYYHPKILLLFFAGNSLNMAWVLSFMRYRRQLDIRRFNQSAGEQNKLIQLIQGMQEIKLNNCERQKRWEWERIQVKLFRINVRSLTIEQVQQIGSTLFTQVTNILISFIAAKAVVDGYMTLGMMMSLTYIIGQVATPIAEFINFVQSFQDARISLERINEIHNQRDEDLDIDSKVVTLPDQHDLTLGHVTFSYSGADRDYALENVSMTIPAGKVTAIVGASGSGKTTLIKILQGFYKPLRGQVKVGNTPLESINPHLWRSLTGSVMQEGYIFSDTIARNIAITDESIDEKRLYHACQVANIDAFIESLPMGFSTRIGIEGNGISAGQRQRILIARAVYKDPDFIFFDEATNALDANNECVIMKRLKDFYKGKTVLIAAHRLSTVCDADNIIVLEHGHVVEQGTHEELIALGGTYYTLVKNQLELGN